MANILRKRANKIQEGTRVKRKLSGWVLEKQPSSFADEGVWYDHDTLTRTPTKSSQDQR